MSQAICVDGEENIQEIVTKQLVLCQYLCALMILRTGDRHSLVATQWVDLLLSHAYIKTERVYYIEIRPIILLGVTYRELIITLL